MTCKHLDFNALVEIARLFDWREITDDEAALVAPDSLAIELTVACSGCGKRVRFEGPIRSDL